MFAHRAMIIRFAAALTLLLAARAQAIPTSNLKLWLAADYGVETTGNAPAANNDPIIAWRDKSGNGNDAFVAAPVGSANSPLLYQPTYKTATLNGKPTLLFHLGPGNQEYARLALTSPLIAGATSFSIFSVVNFSTTSPNAEKIIGANYGNANGGGVEFYAFLQTMRLFEAGSTNGATNVIDNAYHLFTAIRSGNTMSIYIDNQLEATNTYSPGAVGGARNWTIGNAPDYASGPLGNLAEEMVYDRALSTAEQYDVTHYLAQQFALSAIPEPASGVLAAAGMILAFGRRQRVA